MHMQCACASTFQMPSLKFLLVPGHPGNRSAYATVEDAYVPVSLVGSGFVLKSKESVGVSQVNKSNCYEI